MKRIFSALLISFLLLTALLCLTLPVHADASASLTGKSDPRAGDRLELTFSVSGNGFFGVTCSLSYNELQLTLESVSSLMSDPWIVEQSGNIVLIYDNQLTAPIQGETALFTAVFRVKGTLEPDSEIRVSAENINASDGLKEESLPGAVYTAVIGQPRSSDATLSALSAENATLYPAFDPAVTKYTASVPFSVSSLDLHLEKHHPLASYRVTGNQLAVGENTIRIRVTAEDGSVRNYTVTVVRAQDPDYVPSSDATLSALIPSVGILSPAFAPDVTGYVLYLPHECDTLTLSGHPVHALAKAEEITAKLEEGENVLILPVIAEDGSRMLYTVNAIRMPPYGPGLAPVLPPLPETTAPITTAPPETDPVTAPPATTAEPPETPGYTHPTTTLPQESESDGTAAAGPDSTGAAQTAITLLVAVLALGVGFLVGHFRWMKWMKG